MNIIRFLWVPLYLIGAFIDYAFNLRMFVESMIAVLPVFFIGLVVAGAVYFAFKRSKWQWFHVLNTATVVMVAWMICVQLVAAKIANLNL